MSRHYYLDAMRSILMMLGIVLHAAVIFSDKSWLISDNNGSSIYNSIVEFIHLFRMPAFFIVSGFFCHMTLNRYGSKLFLKVRLPRIIIPLVITAITLNSLQNILLTDYITPNYPLFTANYWLQGSWVSHLWFLISLIYYFSFCALGYLLSKGLVERLMELMAWIYLKSGIFSLVLLSLISVLIIKISYLVNLLILEDQFDWVLGDTISYSIYFFFGFVAGHSRSVLNKFTRRSYSTIVVTGLFAILIFATIDSFKGSTFNTLNLLKSSLSTWILTYLCFITFKKLANSSSKYFSFFSEASYSIYLFHHVLVISYAIILSQFLIPHWLMYASIMMLTLISTVIIHHFLISKYSSLKYLFNGKR